jgi:hypothetical protein
MNNLDLWNALSYTNPAHTKQFNKFGKTLSTIDAMHQIKNMTEHFGPIGKGWGYTADYTYTDKLVFAEVTLQWKENQIGTWHNFGAVSSVCALYRGDKLDDEAPKKAMTDALTKAFSHMGLNADIFLGKFDNNKYVDSMKRLHKPENKEALDKLTKMSPRDDKNEE